MIDYIRSLLPSNLNTKPGSALYHLLLLPILSVYNAVKAEIDALELPPNFGIPLIEQKPATGKVKIMTSLSTIPKGTIFVNATEESIETTEDGYSENGEMTVSVESTTNEYSLGTQFTSNAETIYSVEVVSPIVGLIKEETPEEYAERVRTSLAHNTMTRQGLLNILSEFTILDLCYHVDRILLKLPLEKKEVTLTESTCIKDNIVKLTEASNKVTLVTSARWLPNESSIVTAAVYPTKISYLAPAGFKDIISFLDTYEEFPLGYKPKIALAPIYFVTPNTGTVPDKIGYFDVWAYKKTLPIESPVTPSSSVFGAFYPC